MASEEESAGDKQMPAWAVWVGDASDNECVPLLAESEKDARQQATNAVDEYDSVYHVDGPYENSEPGLFEFTFYTEHKETVVVAGPNEEYAEETAEAERDYSGQLVQTTHSESRCIKRVTGGSSE